MLQNRKQKGKQAAGGAYSALSTARPVSPPPAKYQNIAAPAEHKRPAPRAAQKPIAPGQPAQGPRVKQKFVSLPEELPSVAVIEPAPPVDVPTIFEDLLPDDVSRGRIGLYCIAEDLDRKSLEKSLKSLGGPALLHQYPDVLYGQYVGAAGEGSGDIFYFDYGCVAFWGLSEEQEREVLDSVVLQCAVDPLLATEVETDQFEVNYSSTERPHIQNDTITIHHRLRRDHIIKLSISHALAQSTKLGVYEQRVLSIVDTTKDIPELLANTGKVHLPRKEIAQLIGRVFIQKSAVNLLSTVLDTPEFFWSAPDSMQALYARVCEYLEYDTRVEVLNNRFQVLQELLDMVREHQNNVHASRLEWIVIWLIVVEVVVGLFELMSIIGWAG